MLAPLLAVAALASPPVVLGPKDSGRTVSVRAGTTIVVRLDSNPTTGYEWKLAERPARSVLRLVSHRYAAAPTQPGFVGGGGVDTWRFVAVAAGRTSLRLEYVRPWQSGHALKAFRLSLRVT